MNRGQDNDEIAGFVDRISLEGSQIVVARPSSFHPLPPPSGPISIDRGGHEARNCDYVGQLPGENNWAITSHLSCTDISHSSRGGA